MCLYLRDIWSCMRKLVYRYTISVITICLGLSMYELQIPGVYRIFCECGLVEIGETRRNLSMRQKERKANKLDKRESVTIL